MTDARCQSRPALPLAIVIGSGSMGVAIARRLGQRARLLVADLSPESLDRTAAGLRAEGNLVETVVCDIRSVDSAAGLATRVAGLGGFHTLAHVAALSPSMADADTVMAVNLLGAALVEESLRPLALPGAAAVFIASLAGHTVAPPVAVQRVLDNPMSSSFDDDLATALDEDLTPTLAYRLSKYAVIRLCRRRALAWGERGARIVSLSPGMIMTSMGDLEFDRSPQPKLDLLARTPLQRQGNVLEIADAVEFLTSTRAAYITGADLLVDGGTVAATRT